jgi:hypothetical protein
MVLIKPNIQGSGITALETDKRENISWKNFSKGKQLFFHKMTSWKRVSDDTLKFHFQQKVPDDTLKFHFPSFGGEAGGA